MKAWFPFLLVACFMATLSAGGQTPVWTQFADSPSGTTRHDDLCFVSPTHGWSARGRDGIYKTSNGGNTWTKVLTNSSTHFRSIGFVSETVGFAGNLGPGSYDGMVTDTNLLYRTVDGGATWSVVPGLNETGMKGFCAIQVLDEQHIFGGGRVRGPAHFVKSTDGGATWTVVDLTAMGVMNGIMDIYFKDPLNGFVVGMDTNAYVASCGGLYYGRIARTTDGGATWTPVVTTSVSCSYFWKMSWPTPEIGYVSLQQNGPSNRVIVYKTTNGGDTWTSLEVLHSAIGVANFGAQAIGFISENEGWLGGSSTSTPYLNNFLHTTDGGQSWTPVGYNDSRSINKIRFYPNFAVASGAKLHVYRVPLAIGVQPQSLTNVVGSSATFSVTGYGTGPLSFQWRFNGTEIPSAQTDTYFIPSVQPAHAGNYDVIVSDYSGSITSSVAVLTVEGVVVAPTISNHPQSQTRGLNATATFTVNASGSSPLHYQWFFNGTVLPGQISSDLTRANLQLVDAGNYFVVVTNSAGSVTSSVATLTIVSENAFFFRDDFDDYENPVMAISAGTVNGYRLLYGAASGPQDFRAVFGYDYSAVTFPINIPPAPHSTGGTSKGLFMRVNKDGTPSAAAINVYPLALVVSNDFSLKFDLWQNWTNVGSASEHALVGINHSGTVTNRIHQSTSDGLFFAINSDGNVSATASTIRDFGVFRGGGFSTAPILMLTNNTEFGPTPPLGPRFDNTDPGFLNLFPSRPIPGYPNTPAGSPGLSWVSGEIRQERNLITWLLNDVVIAQYTNTFGYTNGTILIGYNDTFDSSGSTNNFVIFDNIRVERIFPAAVTLLSPGLVGENFKFSFATEAGASYSVQQISDLTSSQWANFTNFIGTGEIQEVSIPGPELLKEQYFRVMRP